MHDLSTVLAFAAFVFLAGYLAGRFTAHDHWAAAARGKRPVRWRGGTFWVLDETDA